MKMKPGIARDRMLDGRLATLALATLLASIGVSITTVALPTLAREFSIDVPQAQWVVLAYLLSVTVSIVSCGRLGDLVGHRRVLLWGLAIFAAASALCALAPTLGALIVFRALQGVGGAILLALPISIAREIVANHRLGRAMGLLATASAIGTALGPSAGGLIIAWAGWRATFLALGAIGVVGLLTALQTIPPGARPRGAQGRLDMPGMLVLALALVAYSMAVTGGDRQSSTTLALFGLVAATCAALFVVVERRTTTPLVSLSVLRDPAIAASLVMNVLISAVMMSVLVVGPFYLSFGLGLHDAAVGLVLAIGPAMAAVTGVPAGHVTDRFGARRVLIFGLAQMAIALLCISTLPHRFGIAGFVVSLILLTPSFQLFLAANNTLLMLGAGEKQRGMLSGLLGLSRNLGLMTGASAMGAVFAAAAGEADITRTPPAVVGAAFSVTFLVAAGMVAVSFALALLGERARASHAGAGQAQAGSSAESRG